MKDTLRNCLLMSVCFFVLSSVAFADETKLIVPERSFGIGLTTMSFNYKEDSVNMKEDGFMYGLIGDYTYHGDNKLMLKASLEYAAGNLNYSGQTWSGTSLSADTDDRLMECRGLIGRDYLLKGNQLMTLFTGIAYRYWNDDISGTGGYEREIKYWYSPIGIKLVNPPSSDKWTSGISAEYDFFWSGKVKSHLSDVLSGFNDPEVDQNFGDGYGLRFSVLFERELTQNHALSIEPYIRYWHVNNSDLGILSFNGTPLLFVQEPENETTSYGLRISLVF